MCRLFAIHVHASEKIEGEYKQEQNTFLSSVENWPSKSTDISALTLKSMHRRISASHNKQYRNSIQPHIIIFQNIFSLKATEWLKQMRVRLLHVNPTALVCITAHLIRKLSASHFLHTAYIIPIILAEKMFRCLAKVVKTKNNNNMLAYMAPVCQKTSEAPDLQT